MCFDAAASDMRCGAASSLTVRSRSARRASIARRVASPSARKTRSSLGVARRSTMRLNIGAHGWTVNCLVERSGERQAERKGGARADRAFDGEVAAHRAGELAADGESETDAAAALCFAASRLLERLEDAAELVGG